MLKDQHPIDDLFNTVLHDYQAEPPAYLWSNVKENLVRKAKVRRLRVLQTIAASIAIVVSFAAGHYFALSQQNQRGYALQSPDMPEKHWAVNRSALTENDQNKQQNIAARFRLSAESQTNSASQKNTDSAKNNTSSPEKLATSADTSFENKRNKPLLQKTIAEKNDGGSDFDEQLLDSILHSAPAESYAFQSQKFNQIKQSHWIVGGMFSPVFSFSETHTNENYQSSAITDAKAASAAPNQEMANDLVEYNTTSFSGGVMVEYSSKRRWSIQSGLYYMKFGQVTEEYISIPELTGYAGQTPASLSSSIGQIEPSFSLISGFETNPREYEGIEGNKLRNSDLIQDFEYIEIPLLVKYKLIDKRFDLSVLGGVGANILVGNRVYLREEQTKRHVGNTQNINLLNYVSTVGLGLEYEITPNISFNLEPTFKYSLTPINRNTPVFYHPYSFAFFTGINYRF